MSHMDIYVKIFSFSWNNCYNIDSQVKIGRSQAPQVSGEQIGGSWAAGHVVLREIFGSKQTAWISSTRSNHYVIKVIIFLFFNEKITSFNLIIYTYLKKIFLLFHINKHRLFNRQNHSSFYSFVPGRLYSAVLGHMCTNRCCVSINNTGNATRRSECFDQKQSAEETKQCLL